MKRPGETAAHVASSIPLADFFAFRTPFLSFDDWLRWTSAAGTLAPDDPYLEQKLAAALAALRASLHELLQRPHVREALFLASSRLQESIEVWIRDPETANGQQIERLLISSVSRLVTSAEGRGIAIAPTLGSVGEQTALRVDDRGKLKRDSRLSYGFLLSLAQVLGMAPAMRTRLPLRRNTSLYTTHRKVRFVSSHAAAAAPYYRLVTTPLTPYLACVLERSEHGKLRAELAQAIERTDPEIGGEEAESYVDELIDEDVLVPELGPPLTGANPTVSLVAQLEAYPEAAKAADGLKAATRMLADFDRDGREVSPQRYREVSESLSTTSKLDPSSIIHVRLLRGASTGSVQPRVLEEMLGAAETLRRIERTPDRIR